MKHYRLIPYALLLALSADIWANTGITFQSVSQNLINYMDEFQIFFKALFYTTGVALCVSAVMRLKKFGQRTAFMHVEAGVIAPAAQLFIGVALIYSPQLMDVLNQTVWLTEDPGTLGYSAVGTDQYQQLIQPMKYMIILVGLFAFFRGWLILARSASQGQTQPGTISKGVTHIFGGFLAINIDATFAVVYNTFAGGA